MFGYLTVELNPILQIAGLQIPQRSILKLGLEDQANIVAQCGLDWKGHTSMTKAVVVTLQID